MLIKSTTLKQLLSGTFSILRQQEKNRFRLLALLNLLLSTADIAILVLLLAVVSLYTGAQNKLLLLLPEFTRHAESSLAIGLLLLLFCGKNLLGYLVFRYQSAFFFGIATRLSRQQLFRYLDGSYEEYVRSERSRVFNLVNHRPIEFAQHILSGLQTIFTESVLILVTITAILIFKPVLFVLLLLFLLPPVLLAAVLVRKKLNHIKQHAGRDSEQANQYLNETFSSFIESNIYNKKSFFTERHQHFQQKLSGHLSQLQITQWIPGRLVEIFSVLGLFVVILLSRLLGDQSSLIDIGAFIAAAYKIMPGMVRIANSSALLKTYGNVVADLSHATAATADMSTGKGESITSIQLRKVSFSYKDKEVLQDFSTELRSGDMVCVSGPSGTGKTTFVHLLLGFLQPAGGQVLYNNEVMDSRSFRQYYPSFSYVKQQTMLIRDTLQNNITLEEAHVDRERLAAAVAFAGLDALAGSLKDGLQTVIADEGKDISGGQRQRIAIARAMYHNASVLILDEPFNELDRASEVLLLERLKDWAAAGNIVILVSHNDLCRQYSNKEIRIGNG